MYTWDGVGNFIEVDSEGRPFHNIYTVDNPTFVYGNDYPLFCRFYRDIHARDFSVLRLPFIIRSVKTTKHWISSRGGRGFFVAVPVPRYLPVPVPRYRCSL